MELIEQIEGVDDRFAEVSTLITDPAVIADRKRYVELTREYKQLEKLSAVVGRYKGALNGRQEARELIETETDPEMRAMAKEELESLTTEIEAIEEELKTLLIPVDPEDSK
ncbi:MAG: PCRF domain-containing protein, partial [Muribaculaceae bacterium]|nr:PCRF domain-containing protein [Muribaculaceae bacterium]